MTKLVTRRHYEKVGFKYDRPKGKGNCVMWKKVAPSRSKKKVIANR